MPLALSCTCGTHFEVEETFAGQTVSCPECQAGVTAPAINRQTVRTSGYALASTVLALVLAFTGIGTIVAVLLGIVGLVSIARHRGQVAGRGYALFGIIWGLLFTALFALAIIKGELFSVDKAAREWRMGSQVERGGPLEVKRPGDGYAITRPSPQWTVAKPELAQKISGNRNNLLLANLSREVYLDVAVESLGFQTFDAYRESVLERFREARQRPEKLGEIKPRLSNLKVRHNRQLPSKDGAEQAEILLDVKVGGPNFTFLLRIVRPRDSDTVYLLRAWATRRRFEQMQAEIRQGMDSFRLIDRE
jgi:hypothetical protein